MKSHESEGIRFRRERRFVIDPRNGRRRSQILSILAVVGGSVVCAATLAIVIL